MMKGYITQLVLSVSLAALVYSAPSASKSLSNARNKRSYFADQAQRHTSKYGKKPWTLNEVIDKNKRSGLDTLDFDSILNDPFLMDLDETNLGVEPEGLAPFEDMFPVKDEMSNVIPGAQGPFDAYPLRPEQRIADELMDDFQTFLKMKENGMLEMCLRFSRR